MSLPRSALSVCLALIAAAGAAAASWRLSTEAVWHDNVTNAERPEDLLPALQSRAELSGLLFTRRLAGGQRLHFSVGGRAEFWPRFAGLNVVAPGIAAGWEWKPGLGLQRPVFVAEGEGEWVAAQERDRGGLGGAARLAVHQRVGTAWRLQAGHEWRRFDARPRAFDRTGREWFGRVERSAGADWNLALEGRERVGDVLSYSRPPRLDLAAIGKPITYVDTFQQDVPWIAYYFRARTRSVAAEVQRSLGRSTLTLRHEYRHTLHAGPGYKNHLTSLRCTFPF